MKLKKYLHQRTSHKMILMKIKNEIITEEQVELAAVTVQGEKSTFILSEYISLNSAISNIHIMYSDFELPYSLLKEIEKSPDSRASWMREINLQAPSVNC